MRFPVKRVLTKLALVAGLLSPCVASAAQPVLVLADEPGSWPKILNPVGIAVNQTDDLPPQELAKHVDNGAIAILTGDSEHSRFFAIHSSTERIAVKSLIDKRQPKLSIVWEKAAELPRYTLPTDSIVFASERWTSAPLLAGLRRGKGAVLWLAVQPGAKGYERFPYLVQALADLGLEIPLQSNRLWAFFDGAYRSRADLDYLAERWRKAGISALHVAAWHYVEPSPEQADYLRSVIAACHRRAIQVYAWLELPHVGEKFWQDHPSCREKTALLQDAHLDWRKLVNLSEPECANKAAVLTDRLIRGFDWDGVNLAELYFESLEGMSNPGRFTPMNDAVRDAYRKDRGIDPLDLFKPGATEKEIGAFLDFRAGLAQKMQEDWIARMERIRVDKPDLDLVLTHVDDRFDTRMRSLIGADASRVLPLLGKHDFTFLIEDPATVWHLGPERYTEIASKYVPLTTRREKLAIDINIVERYQDVYPTKQQTGTELLQLIHLSSRAFTRVAVYFENSILKPDLPLLSAAGAVATRFERNGGSLILDTPQGAGVNWAGAVLVDSRPWPVTDGRIAWVPKGAHVLSASADLPKLRIEEFNLELKSAAVTSSGIEFAYESAARAMVRFNEEPSRIEVDGEPFQAPRKDKVFLLPRGQHIVTVHRSAAASPQPTASDSERTPSGPR